MNMCTKEIKDNPHGYRNPGEHGLKHKEIRIKTKDNLSLYGWFMFAKENAERLKSLPTFIYFHENAGNIGFRLPFTQLLIKELKANVLVMGYRGYGYSEGEPTEKGLMLDAEAIVDYVFNKETELSEFIDKNNIYIFGRSLGGAVAVYITEKLKPNIRGVILENTFSSMGDMVDHLFPALKSIKSLLLTNHWPSRDRIKNLKYPILFISSEKDELVPAVHMEELFKSATSATFKNKFVILGGTHNESWQKAYDQYVQEFSTFLSKCESLVEGEIVSDIIDEGAVINEESSINKEEETYLIYKKDD
jgi:fermentation-respiration switch protein FrsA (DUF1100 family)